MTLTVTVEGKDTNYDLDALASSSSGIITIGKKCKEVWNAISIEDDSVDAFQCHIIGGAGAPMRLNNGQERTECPKGLMSNKLIPCNGCLGRCVNLHAGRPKYYQRDPETPTLINGEAIGQWGTVIKAGDVITCGNVSLSVH